MCVMEFDRRTKAPLYARAGIDDYWIVNLNASQVEVHRQPLPPDQIFGSGYTDVKTYRTGGASSRWQNPAFKCLWTTCCLDVRMTQAA
jgi:Uma2 family endonuclease